VTAWGLWRWHLAGGLPPRATKIKIRQQNASATKTLAHFSHEINL
jgi:hypothetical protein